jgi:hypothetical protein
MTWKGAMSLASRKTSLVDGWHDGSVGGFNDQTAQTRLFLCTDMWDVAGFELTMPCCDSTPLFVSLFALASFGTA